MKPEKGERYVNIKGGADTSNRVDADKSINITKIRHNGKSNFYTYDHKSETARARDILLQTQPATKQSAIYQDLIGNNILKRITYRDIEPVETIIPTGETKPILIGLDKKAQKYVEITEQGKMRFSMIR